MADGSISQSELDKLFGTLEELPVSETPAQQIWLVKSKNGAIFGGRCYNMWQAQALLQRAQKDYPSEKISIMQVK